MSHYSNCHTTTCHIIPNNTWPHVTLFQKLHDHMPHYSNYYTTTYHIIPFVAPVFWTHVILFQLSQDEGHIIPTVTRPYVTLFQMSLDHMSHYSNCYMTTYHIIPIDTRPYVTLFQLSHDLISHYSNFTRPQVTLFQLSHYHMSHYSNIYTKICHITLSVTRPLVTLFQLTHNHISHYSN